MNEEYELLIQKAQIGRTNKDDLLNAKEQLESALEDVNAECGSYENAFGMLEHSPDYDGTEENAKEHLKNYGVEPISKDEYKELCEKRNRISYYLTEIEKYLEGFKYFDKYTCFNNIRALLKVKPEIKIGMIEKNAGLRLGYMSRLEKQDNRSEPSVEFIVTAARLLGVSVDFLINAKFTETTKTEEYVINFLQNVMNDTDAGKLYWRKDSPKSINMPSDISCNYGPPPHPLQEPDEETMNYEGFCSTASFHSHFFPEKGIEAIGNIYHAELGETENQFYILPCRIFNSTEDGEVKECYEVHLLDLNNGVIPLCNSLLAANTVGVMLKNLYMQIEEATSHVNVDKKARNVIDAYMNNTKAEKFFSDSTDSDTELPFK